MDTKPRLPFFVSALLLLAWGGFLEARCQASSDVLQFNPDVEHWIRQQVAQGQPANVESAFPDESKRVIRSAFLFELLTKPPQAPTGAQALIWVSTVTVIGDLYLTYQQIPYDLVLERCHFLGNLSFNESAFKKNLSLSGSTFEKSVGFRAIEVSGSFVGTNCHFNNEYFTPDQQVDFEYAKIGRNLAIEGAEFHERVSFLRSHVSQIFAAEAAKFLNKASEAKFEDLKVDGAFQIRRSQIDCPANFLSATTGVFDARFAHFNGQASFWKLKVNGDAMFDGTSFGDAAIFHGAEVTKDFEVVDSAVFTDSKQVVDFSSMNIGGNARFLKVVFAGGLSLSRTSVTGNLELGEFRAEGPGVKDLSVVKTDNLIFQNISVAPPYFINGMSYRLLFAPQDEVLRFVDGAEYDANNPNIYKNLEGFYQQQGNLEGAKAVHVAWKKRESSVLGPCTLCLNRNSRLFGHPSQYLLNWFLYVTTVYGQHLEVALLWSVGFIGAGYLVFRRREWMEATHSKSNKVLRFKREFNQQNYNPWWYSIALFLPVVSLRDKDDWIPKADRWKSRIYMRLHIIFGYLLIPIGLAALTGLIK